MVDTTRYKNKSFPSFDGLRRGGLLKYQFSSWKTSSHLLVQTKTYFRVLKKGKHLSIALEINLLRATILPVSVCLSFMIFREVISSMAYIFSGCVFSSLLLTSILSTYTSIFLSIYLLNILLTNL